MKELPNSFPLSTSEEHKEDIQASSVVESSQLVFTMKVIPPHFTIILPKQLFIDLTNEDTKTPSPKLQLSSPSVPNAPFKTPSTKGTSSSPIVLLL
ncbi:hypothetical protein Tco_0615748 [Tanacetum coccineum]